MRASEIVRDFKVVLWDFDGTLVERPDMWCTCIARACARVGEEHLSPLDFDNAAAAHLPWNRPELAHTASTSADLWWRQFFERIEPLVRSKLRDPANVGAVLRLMRQDVLEPTGYMPIESSKAFLLELHRLGLRQAVVSNHVPELDAIVGQLFPSVFSDVWTSGRIGFEKPRPEFFEHVLSHLGTPASELLLVGDDNYRDLRPAERHGMTAIDVATFAHSEA